MFLKKCCTALTMLVLWAGMTSAEPPTITAFEHNGVLTWTNTTNTNARYRVEWASDLQTPMWAPLHNRGGAQMLDIEAGSNGVFTTTVPMHYRVVMITNTPPEDMVLVPGGSFMMGDTFSENHGGELPVHEVTVDSFWIGRGQVSWREWQEVRAWATNVAANPYQFDSSPQVMGKAEDHPVVEVSWYDAVKWCNARSEMEGRTPCYYLSSFSVVYRTGSFNVANDRVLWRADGYRLPTEAEWEYAARGGQRDRRFPWGNTISHEQSNYGSVWVGGTPVYPYDVSREEGRHPRYRTGEHPGTSPTTAFAANGYGLHGLAGNASDWCWDWYDASYYASSPSNDPLGPDVSTSKRVLRGGAYSLNAYYSRNANRTSLSPGSTDMRYGFRVVVGDI